MARIAGRALPDGHLILREQASTTKRAIELGTELNAMLVADGSVAATPTWSSSNPDIGGAGKFGLAEQLRIVARIIGGASKPASGIKRQVFMVRLDGFDTHDGQPIGHARLMGRLSMALDYFNTLLASPAIDAANAVTVFTASEFGRTFGSNGDGTDHGWGAHHFVMGGAVRGGDFYGRFPQLAVKNTNNNNFDASPDQLGNGALLPQTSVDQLGATLGRWFGLSDTQLLEVFPNLANFNVGHRNLGFMA